MRHEEAFLSAIRAAPADDAVRLMYADWLEEQGEATSARAEYVRLRTQTRQKRDRKRNLARLAELTSEIDLEWAGWVFPVPRLTIKGFRRVKRPVTRPVTKFGGQPVWLGDPIWPMSREDDRPMQFVCQVAVPDFLGPGLAGKMVYLFVNHAEHENWREFCGTISPLYPDEGENAVVIQPGGDPPAPTVVLPLGARGQRRRKRPLPVEGKRTGPTLYDKAGKPGEWLPSWRGRSIRPTR
jgi:uncharacterized protein (TIGR02996 family)